MSHCRYSLARAIAQRRTTLAVVVAVAGLAVSLGSAQTDTASPPSDKRTFLHQEVDFDASPQRIYEILLDSKQFSAFSGMPAEISAEVGGAVSMFGGQILGRNIELVPNERIVQAWRERDWPPGVYSLVKFELKGEGSKTRILFDHTGFGEGHFEHLNVGWKLRYWDPLKKFLAAK